MMHSKPLYLPWVMLVAPSLSLGAVAFSYLSVIPSAQWMWLVAGCLLLSVVSLWMMKTWRVFSWLMIGLSLGSLLMYQQMLTWQSERIPELWYQQPFQAEVVVDSICKPVVAGWQCDVKTVTAPAEQLKGILVQAYWHGDSQPMAGEHWLVNVSLQPIHGQMNFAGFDYEGYAFGRGVQAQALVKALSTQPISTQWHWQKTRWVIFSHLQKSLPNSAFLGLNLALLMGDASLITPEQWQVLRDTGTLHLAVVSGMHLTLVGALAGVLCLWLWRLFPSERFSASVVSATGAFIVASCYAVLAGLNLPVQRAWLMVSVVLIAVLLKRHFHPLLSLSWALLLVMLWDITSVMQVGFWLSFLATAALVWLLSSPEGWYWKLLGLHLSMSFLLAPFLMVFFQQLPIYAPLANIIAAPVVESVFVPLLLFAGIASFVSTDLTCFIGGVVDGLWRYLWDTLTGIANWSSSVVLVSVSGWQWGFLGLWAMVVLRWRQQLTHPVGLLWLALPSVILPLLPAHSLSFGVEQQRVIVLDVGKSQPVLIWQGEQGNWLFGVGEVVGHQHSMSSIILPTLTHLGIHQLDGIWLWQDNDDTKKGVQLLRQKLPVQRVQVNHQCRPEQGWLWQTQGANCWLVLPLPSRKVWFSPMKMSTLPESLTDKDVIIATPAINQPVIKPIHSVAMWISQGKLVPRAWAVQRLSTQEDGAISLLFSAGRVTTQTARSTVGRFYHFSAE